jgi:hypothetical protein
MGLCFASFDFEAYHTTESPHLFFCQVVVLVRLESGIVHCFDVRMPLKKVSNVIGTSCGLYHPELEGLKPSKSEIAVHRARAGA